MTISESVHSVAMDHRVLHFWSYLNF